MIQAHQLLFLHGHFLCHQKRGRSSRRNTCCQLFVTDKGFVYVVPMRQRSDLLAAMKQFAKEIGAPDAIGCDMSKRHPKQFDTSATTLAHRYAPWKRGCLGVTKPNSTSGYSRKLSKRTRGKPIPHLLVGITVLRREPAFIT